MVWGSIRAAQNVFGVYSRESRGGAARNCAEQAWRFTLASAGVASLLAAAFP